MMDTLMVELDLLDEMVSINELGHEFNELRSVLHDILAEYPSGTQFTLADAEVSVEGSSATITLVAVFGHSAINSEFIFPGPFGSNDKWSIYEKGGRFGTSTFDGVLGSPEVLTNAINYDINGGLYTFFVNISIINVPPVNGGPSLLYDPSNYGAADNPMYVNNSTYWLNKIMHYVYVGPNNNHADESWVIPSAMTYYRTYIPSLAYNYVANYNKTLKSVRVKSTVISGGSPNLYPVLHYLKITAGNTAPLITLLTPQAL